MKSMEGPNQKNRAYPRAQGLRPAGKSQNRPLALGDRPPMEDRSLALMLLTSCMLCQLLQPKPQQVQRLDQRAQQP